MEVSLLSDSFKVKSSIQDYEVHFISSLEEQLDKVYCSGDYVIVDKIVQELHPQLRTVLNSKNVILINAVESTKSYEGIIPFIEELIRGGFKRNNRLIAIGGGITQDVTAFIASILYRGVGWIFFPTTLLAQGDSCIGSKTSINFKEFKNQIGGFYPPLSIFIDSNYLNSLLEKDIRSGVGEMAHYFFVSGPDDVVFFEDRFENALIDNSSLNQIIKRSLSIKKSYIEKDEFDKNERIVFNYGHTFGHAIESITNYGIPHGVAVTYGMDMANFISVKKGYIEQKDFEYANNIFKQIWKGYSIDGLNLKALLSAMGKDKKNENGRLGLILTKGWGRMFKDLTEPDEVFISWMKEYLKTHQ